MTVGMYVRTEEGVQRYTLGPQDFTQSTPPRIPPLFQTVTGEYPGLTLSTMEQTWPKYVIIPEQIKKTLILFIVSLWILNDIPDGAHIGQWSCQKMCKVLINYYGQESCNLF
ncbi:hypothetical protein AB205_0132890 [Aquarana catesbeiana]|uniref:Uncharacterized protein n=1 Tax=Aquarana catesbeiana TaxID=8400 RepID=A0A2G9S6H5_AQUCT|nr:hypothetical protein AB205_0132890 [Aquarana catesbeiana]